MQASLRVGFAMRGKQAKKSKLFIVSSSPDARDLRLLRHFQHSNDVSENTDFFQDEDDRNWGPMERELVKKHCFPLKRRKVELIKTKTHKLGIGEEILFSLEKKKS